MSRKFILFLVILLTFSSLSACGGGGSTPDDNGGGDGDGGDGGGDGNGDGDGDGDGDGISYDPLLHVITDPAVNLAYFATFLPDVERVDTVSTAGPAMLFADLPPTGNLDYEGYMNLQIFSSIASADVDGIAVLTITLDDQSLSGTVDGFRGMVTNNEQDYLVSYEGILTFSNGLATPDTTNGTAISLDVDGTLDNGLNMFLIDGTLVGGLNGSGGEGLRAKGSGFGSQGSMAITIDDTPGQLGVGTLSAELVPPAP